MLPFESAGPISSSISLFYLLSLSLLFHFLIFLPSRFKFSCDTVFPSLLFLWFYSFLSFLLNLLVHSIHHPFLFFSLLSFSFLYLPRRFIFFLLSSIPVSCLLFFLFYDLFIFPSESPGPISLSSKSLYSLLSFTFATFLHLSHFVVNSSSILCSCLLSPFCFIVLLFFLLNRLVQSLPPHSFS